mmetsp:Transcript_63144/g.178392  ORF Transcript_63144/g.178392 Transcript_63144/m.178392 type:complete len:226 (+) Transcript_63144:252-929(+)
MPKMTSKERCWGSGKCSPASIFRPTKASTAARPFFRPLTLSKASASRRYRDLNPRIASMFELKTKKRSCVRPKMQGMESTAKSKSLNSTTTNAASTGVAWSLPPIRSTKLLLRDSAWYGMTAVKQRIIHELPFLWASAACSSSSSSPSTNILYADQSKSAANTYTMPVNLSIKATPAKMKMVRKITAPKMPHFSTGPWNCGLMRKLLKMRAMTTRLSTLKLFSRR